MEKKGSNGGGTREEGEIEIKKIVSGMKKPSGESHKMIHIYPVGSRHSMRDFSQSSVVDFWPTVAHLRYSEISYLDGCDFSNEKEYISRRPCGLWAPRPNHFLLKKTN